MSTIKLNSSTAARSKPGKGGKANQTDSRELMKKREPEKQKNGELKKQAVNRS